MLVLQLELMLLKAKRKERKLRKHKKLIKLNNLKLDLVKNLMKALELKKGLLHKQQVKLRNSK